MKRKIRRIIDILLTGFGIGLIIVTVLLGELFRVSEQWPVVLVGVLLLEAGVWGLSTKAMSNERRFMDLREEGDNMIKLMRELNSAALAKNEGEEDEQRFKATLEKMYSSVKRMGTVAATVRE